MEGFLGFISFLGVVWSILCFILFFKVWGMCNNVSKILEILTEREYGDEQETAPTKQVVAKPQVSQKAKSVANPPKKGNKTDEDKQDSMMAFNNDCLALFRQCKSKEEFESGVDDIISKYNKADSFDYSTLKDGLWEQFKQL